MGKLFPIYTHMSTSLIPTRIKNGILIINLIEMLLRLLQITNVIIIRQRTNRSLIFLLKGFSQQINMDVFPPIELVKEFILHYEAIRRGLHKRTLVTRIVHILILNRA